MLHVQHEKIYPYFWMKFSLYFKLSVYWARIRSVARWQAGIMQLIWWGTAYSQPTKIKWYRCYGGLSASSTEKQYLWDGLPKKLNTLWGLYLQIVLFGKSFKKMWIKKHVLELLAPRLGCRRAETEPAALAVEEIITSVSTLSLRPTNLRLYPCVSGRTSLWKSRAWAATNMPQDISAIWGKSVTVLATQSFGKSVWISQKNRQQQSNHSGSVQIQLGKRPLFHPRTKTTRDCHQKKVSSCFRKCW